MHRFVITSRSLLVVVLTALTVTSPSLARQTDAPIVGSWSVIGVGAPDTPADDPLLFRFDSDGTVTIASRSVRPALPESTFSYMYVSTGIGAWQTTADGTTSFAVEHIRTDETGTYHGRTTFAGTLLVSNDGLTVQGNATYYAHNLEGIVIAEMSTPLEGTRIVVEPAAQAAPGVTPEVVRAMCHDFITCTIVAPLP